MNCRHVQDKLDDYVFDLLDDDERTEVETHLEACDDCRSACRRARARRRHLEQWDEEPAPGELAETTLAALNLGQHASGDRPGNPGTPLGDDWPWLTSGRFWTLIGSVAAAVFLVAALYVHLVMGPPPKPQETTLVGLRWLAPGQPIACRLVVRNGRDGSPVDNFDVVASLWSDDGEQVWRWTTEARATGGVASIEDRLPETLPEGDYTLGVVTSSALGRNNLLQQVTVRRGARVMVSTDKPLYQPGQLIRIRTLSLQTSDLKPVEDKPVTVEVQDAKGNKVFKEVVRTSAFGIAATDFELADQVNLGDYTITATLDKTVSHRSVRVARYRLPTFKVTLTPDRTWYAPGDVLEGDVSAQYTFGKPVAGARVRVSASEFLEAPRTFADIEGTTDSDGRFHFALNLKEYFVGSERTRGNASVQLDATVVDRADHEQSTTTRVPVAARPIHVEVFPESGTLVQGVENLLYIVTAYPDGTPARTRLTIGATDRQAQTSELGIAQVHITPHDTDLQLTVTAVDDRGHEVTVTQPLRVGETDQRVLLRTDRPLYRTGETMDLTVLSADDRRVFVDVIRDGRAVLMRSVDVRGGRGTLSVDLPDDLFGTLEVNAYRIMDGSEITADTKIVQVHRATDLSVTATLDKDTYRPAETAILNFAVTDAEGRPAVAALSLSGVDEAVFALHQMHPGLEQVYFLLQEELLKPRVEMHGTTPGTVQDLIGPEPQPQQRREATVVLLSAAEGSTSMVPMVSGTDYRTRLKHHRHGSADALATWANASLAILMIPAIVVALTALGLSGSTLNRRDAKSVDPDDRETIIVNWNWLLTWLFPAWVVVPLAAMASYGSEPDPLAFLVILWGIGVILFVVVYKLCHESPAGIFVVHRRIARLSVLLFAIIATVITIMTVTQSFGRYRAISSDMMSFCFVVLSGCGAALTIALLIGRHSLEVRHRFYAIVLELLVCFALLMLLASMLLPTLSRAREAARRSGAADNTELYPEWSQPSPAPGSLATPSRIRRYFPETLLWQPEVITDENGRARIDVPLADSITTWRIAAGAVSRNGLLGSTTVPLRVFQPFFVDIDFPVALTQNDRVSVPVAVYNYLDAEQTVRLEVQDASWFTLNDSTSKSLTVGPREVTRVYFTLTATRPGRHALTVKAFGSKLADAVRREVVVRPDGREVAQTVNGTLGDGPTHRVVIPPRAVDGANDLVVKIYPGSFSQVLEGLDGIFAMPHGCFEQTTSTTYPNILVLDYLRRTEQAVPKVEMKARNYIRLGYQRLLTFEVEGGGFSLFGNPPADAFLSAYGLMEFLDMSRTIDVDRNVIARTRRWLLEQQRSDGSFAATGTDDDRAALRTTAYIAWTLAESGDTSTQLGRALNYLVQHPRDDTDTYTLALCANALVAAGRSTEAAAVLQALDGRKRRARNMVHWPGTGSGVMHSRGPVLTVETTALAAYACMKARHDVTTAHEALAWLVANRDARGTWHSTQATVLAMRALIEGTGSAGGVLNKPAEVTIMLDGKTARTLTITPETSDVHRLVSLRELVHEGTNVVALQSKGGRGLAYQVVATHYLPHEATPTPQQRRPLTIDVRYDTRTLKVNDLLQAHVTVNYSGPGSAEMVVVDLGVPPGFDVLAEDFDALVKRGVIERYSLGARQVILYFRRIPSGEPVTFTWRLRARYPVRAKVPGSKVYQYYQPEIKDETPPVTLSAT